MRRILMAAAALVVLMPATALAGGGGGDSLCAGFAGGSDIAMFDSCFQGTAHFAAVDATIVIRNEGFMPHTYTAVDGSFDTGQLQNGEEYELVVDEPGVYEVFCSLHGTAAGDGMAGVLLVGEPAQLAITAPASLDLITQAVAEGNQVVAEALDNHAVMIAGLTSSHSKLSRDLQDQAAASVVAAPEAPAPRQPLAPTVVSEPRWASVTLGVVLGLALAGLVTVTFNRGRVPLRPGSRAATEPKPGPSG